MNLKVFEVKISVYMTHMITWYESDTQYGLAREEVPKHVLALFNVPFSSVQRLSSNACQSG